MSVLIETSKDEKFPSSLVDGGYVSWAHDTSSNSGEYSVSYPDIRWKQLRSIFGWSALQHHSVLHIVLTITAPSDIHPKSPVPTLHLSLQQASYIALVPRLDGHSPQGHQIHWLEGDIYAQSLDQSILVPLPSAFFKGGRHITYDIFISVDYEIRLFGDPIFHGGSDVPVSQVRLIAELVTHDDGPIVTSTMVPDFLEGWALGDVIGISVQNGDAWSLLESIEFDQTSVSTYNYVLRLLLTFNIIDGRIPRE